MATGGDRRGVAIRGGERRQRRSWRRVTEPHDIVATDLPVSAVLANRLVPGPLVDTAYLRFKTGSLTPAEVLGEIDRWCVAAVVAGRAFADEPAVMRGLKQRFARATTASGATVVFDRRSPAGLNVRRDVQVRDERARDRLAQGGDAAVESRSALVQHPDRPTREASAPSPA